MQTITVVASRSGAFTETELLIGSAVVVALVAWAVLSRIKHFGGKPHA